MTSFNPGPWARELDGVRDAWIKDADGHYVALACGEGEDQARANARLIEQAPALIGHLSDLLAAYGANALEMNSPEIESDEHEPYPWHEEWLSIARDLICKARGG